MVRVRFAPDLKVSGGRLTEAGGIPVHAATFLHRRLIVLDSELLKSAQELKRIWIHELSHFTWQRLGNPRRRSWEELLLREVTKGELGWSAQWRKNRLTALDREHQTRAWREYCCESFCDTAAWLASAGFEHAEATLSKRDRAKRKTWFDILQ